MAGPSIPAGYGRFSLEFAEDASSHISVITWGFVDKPSVDPSTLASDIRTLYVASFILGSLSSHWEILAARTLINRGGAEVAGVDPTVSAGTLSGNIMPTGMCAPLRKRTANVGRKYRGRVFLPAGYLLESNVDVGGVIDSGLVTTLTDAWQDFIVAMASNATTMVLLHTDGSTPTGVVTGECAPRVAWQRRRNR